MINIICPSRYKVSRPLLKEYATKALQGYSVPQHFTLNLIFIGKNKMREIAKKYKAEDVALPVLTFRYDKSETGTDEVIGEVFICYPQAILLAAERHKTVEQIFEFLVEHAVNNIFS